MHARTFFVNKGEGQSEWKNKIASFDAEDHRKVNEYVLQAIQNNPDAAYIQFIFQLDNGGRVISGKEELSVVDEPMTHLLTLKRGIYKSVDDMVDRISKWLNVIPWILPERKEELLHEAQIRLKEWVQVAGVIVPLITEVEVESRGNYIDVRCYRGT